MNQRGGPARPASNGRGISLCATLGLIAAAFALLAPPGAAAAKAPVAPQVASTPAASASVVTTASGLRIQTLVAGQGARPRASDVVQVVYIGRVSNGAVYDAAAAGHAVHPQPDRRRGGGWGR